MDKVQFSLPEEASELTASELAALRASENALRQLFASSNLTEVLPPMFEYVDFYRSLGADFDSERMFQLINHEGKTLSLRYDFTLPIARTFALSNLTKQGYSYFGQVFRKEARHKGRDTATMQSGVELIGDFSDGEALELAQNALQTANLSDVKWVIGSSKIFDSLSALIGPDSLDLQEIFAKKKLSALTKIPSEIRELVKLCLISDDLSQILIEAKKLSLSELTAHLTDLSNLTKALNADFCFDFGLLAPMPYYTGVIFQVYQDNAAKPILSGGRYDALLEKLGKPASAVGFCIDMNQILKGGE
ncbi:MAG: ATP phosphoribosyltransferase regulatory subunit [Streptococcaceae bacterium]|jgi:ATP phosphoribosyltransferase regulatory subunit|nr:ATP phosphoribosyltransferase regulatory subunit [Streptococcaceae bacterium]